MTGQVVLKGPWCTIDQPPGQLHGYAYGESIVGAESSPRVGYLLGFSLVQLARARLLWSLGRSAANARQVVVVRALSALSAVVGVVALV